MELLKLFEKLGLKISLDIVWALLKAVKSGKDLDEAIFYVALSTKTKKVAEMLGKTEAEIDAVYDVTAKLFG